MKTKRLLCPQRLRTVPHQFSWIDQRLVREGHIARCGGTQALALYLLLVTVADSQGLSFYSDKTAARLLCISEAELRHARLGLLHAGLIAYEAPFYQVNLPDFLTVARRASQSNGPTSDYSSSVPLRLVL